MNRRQIAQTLTRTLNASVNEILSIPFESITGRPLRIGITGAPGVGKSSIIAKLAAYRANQTRKIAVLAIDPSSPLTGGSLLGDRIRMGGLVDNPDVYVRSLPSRNANDGLCNNIPALINLLEVHGFSEIILETVGVGQAEYAIRNQVDIVILVMQPESGDVIQSMKAGIVEMADILLVNKNDLKGADKVCAELEEIASRGGRLEGWFPPVVRTCVVENKGIKILSEAIDEAVRWQAEHRDNERIAIERRRYQLQSLLERRINELLDEASPEFLLKPLVNNFKAITTSLFEEI
ncbi:MAG: methylmalonyl Co-A mutase-associated GTPase MeaB [Piscirickettsiaceae bacterium]|nr:MAG: methylmalonyl Co-A mutase-associated GTPase MeaB [Piscirickettsiaceae bacterium]